jgi:hypothetical protein
LIRQPALHDPGSGLLKPKIALKHSVARRCVVTDDVGWLPEQGQYWTGLQSLVMVESTRNILVLMPNYHCAKSLPLLQGLDYIPISRYRTD